MRNSILAVLPRMRFSSVGSCKPGTCTRMRSVPWRWISGSTVPSSLMRRSTIWIDCSIVCRMRSVMAACGTVRRISPPPASDDFEAALPAGAEQTAERLRQLAQLGKRRLQVGILDADLDRVVARRQGRYSRSWPRAARGGRRRAPDRAFPSSRSWNRLRAADTSRPANRGRARCGAAPIPARSSPAPRGRSSEPRNRQTTSAVRMIASAFHRVKYNIELTRQIQENAPREAARETQLADDHAEIESWRSCRAVPSGGSDPAGPAPAPGCDPCPGAGSAARRCRVR